jgi:signal transduction histidine kinase
MYKRLIIFSVIIFGSLVTTAILGYVAVDKWAEGLAGKRLGEFAEVAEQIRGDVKRKLDEFMQAEQDRPYTHYQYYYFGDYKTQTGGLQQTALVRSPLAGVMENEFAYGYFQIDPNGRITTPSDAAETEGAAKDVSIKNTLNIDNVKYNVLPALKREKIPNGKAAVKQGLSGREAKKAEIAAGYIYEEAPKSQVSDMMTQKGSQQQISNKSKSMPIESLKQQAGKTQVLTQRRDVTSENIMLNSTAIPQQQAEQSNVRILNKEENDARKETEGGGLKIDSSSGAVQQGVNQPVQQQQAKEADTVQIRIEPFVPVVTGGGEEEDSIFGGQVFYLRHIQIEDKHLIQGFRFDQARLLEEIKKSANRFIREGMGFEVSRQIEKKAAFSAILDFGFGEIALNLRETVDGWMENNISRLRWWYFATLGIVFAAVTGGLASLWLNARAQVKLAEKKDDFISAVSHELRTPLTSIRMYSEMLDKGWVRDDSKRAEYYKGMQQETERLSRLVENVLDFSRIQKKRKKYSFKLGDINDCIRSVVEMMRPFAAQNGFSIRTIFGKINEVKFDRDAVTQIVVNLLDNAIKYAREAEDKTIIVQTRIENNFIIIEVEDHGPGVPHIQRKKIFEEFYRIGSEATRETKGTGLGLALVKKFAEAHNGFVEISGAKPAGAIFRVALSTTI